MKAPDFQYICPQTKAELLALLDDRDCENQIIAGGQSLMPMMNFRLAQPERLVDINAIADLKGITLDGDTLRIGALTTYAEVMADATAMKAVPLLGTVLPHVAHDAIRNRGTVGGSISLADPAAELPALALALNASVVLECNAGERVVAADEFFMGLYETACEDHEIVTALLIPAARPGDRFGFRELARRHGDYAMAGVVVAARADAPLRAAFFGIADRAVRIDAVETALAAYLESGDPAMLDQAVAGLEAVDMVADSHLSETGRRHMAGVVLRRAVEDLSR